jgi:hypothetical protein
MSTASEMMSNRSLSVRFLRRSLVLPLAAIPQKRRIIH